MGYAKHVGRIGALAVTLGVGVALGGTPGVAAADTGSASGAGTSGTSQQRDTSAPRESSATGKRAGSGENAERRRDRRESRSEERATSRRDQQRASQDVDEVQDPDESNPKQNRTAAAATEAPEQSVPEPQAAQPDPAPEPEEAQEAPQQAAPPEAAAPVAAALKSTRTGTLTPQRRAPKSSPTRERATLATAVSTFVSALLSPAAAPGRGAPLQASAMVAALGAVRDELERNNQRRLANVVTQQANVLAVDDSPNVLVIGVDGANLARVLTNPAMTNFLSLIGDSTTAPASIVGHTTISNPSWSSILTGVWGERTGVINNVFTPWTYDRFPTVYDLIERQNPNVHTTSIANWNVISAIANAGQLGADVIINVNQVPGDTNWLATDSAVGQETVDAIARADLTVPNFIFSYFVGVDENGHEYGGASEQYELALENFDANLGRILDAISNSGEDWTILMVTDHGHQPQLGLGHGFQSPDETSTFVLAYNPGLFTGGGMNLQYEIVDVTPTVLALLGLDTAGDFDGSSLLDKGGTVVPVGSDPDEALNQALLDAIGKYGYPDIGTQLALGARTVFSSIPYFVQNLTISLTSGLQDIADMEIFLVSLLAKVAIAPVQLLGDVLYVATNIVAQIVARLTGVTGASIFPLWPPTPPPSVFTPDGPADARTGLVCGSTELLQCAATVAV
ncbi:alkaline phosphatase family protein [Mycolicibacterium vaccae]|uniref:alkaline phosphatase family protein n=1 Tax=Mycolicibacterium vaccae TaxID=1810 RepID=UPI003CE94599